MKNLILITLILFCTSNLNLDAQSWRMNNDTKQGESIKPTNTNPFERDIIMNPYENSFYWYLSPLYYQTFQVGYERFVNQKFKRRSIHGSLGVILEAKRFSRKDGFVLELQYRVYFDVGNEKIDLFGAPYIQFDKLEIKEQSNVPEKISSFSGGFTMGGKIFIFRQGIIELQLGGEFRKSTPNKLTATAFEFGYTGVFGRINVGVGFAF